MNYQERLYRQSQGYECDPTGSTYYYAAMMIIAAASTVATVQGQQANAKAQENMQAEQTSANNKIISLNTAQTRDQEAQALESSKREQEKARLANQRAKATAATAAGEAGISGNSYDALIQEYKMQEGQFQEASIRQQQLIRSGAQSQVDATTAGGAFSNLQINAPIQQPQYAIAGLNFASSAYGATRDYQKDRKATAERQATAGGLF